MVVMALPRDSDPASSYEAIRTLNNQATHAIAAGQHDQAAAILVQVEQLLRQPAASGHGVDALMCEYFYRCHSMDLDWQRARYGDGLDHALRGVAIEDTLWHACGAEQPDQFAFSHASWGLISMLTRCQRPLEAEQVFRDLLDDLPRFQARRRCRRDSLESALLAGLCLFFEHPAAGWFERGLPLVERAEQLLGTPENIELLLGLGSYHARLGNDGRARTWIKRGLEAGVAADRIRDDEDLGPIFKRPVRHPGWEWTIQSTPPGAAIWIDDQDTGRQTPALIRVDGPGKHKVRLELAGHVPLICDDTPESNWTWGPVLESHAAVEAARIASEQATQPTSADDQRATAEFLGSTAQRKQLQLELRRAGSYYLDELRIVIDGRGHGEVRVGNYWHKHRPDHGRVKLDGAVIDQVCAAIEASGLTGIVIASRPGVPDEISLHITVRNSRGEKLALTSWASGAPPRFRQIFDLGQLIVERLEPALRTALGLGPARS